MEAASTAAAGLSGKNRAMIYHQTEEGLGHLLITWSEEDDTQSFRYYKLVRDYLEDLRRKKVLTALFL